MAYYFLEAADQIHSRIPLCSKQKAMCSQVSTDILSQQRKILGLFNNQLGILWGNRGRVEKVGRSLPPYSI